MTTSQVELRLEWIKQKVRAHKRDVEEAERE